MTYPNNSIPSEEPINRESPEVTNERSRFRLSYALNSEGQAAEFIGGLAFESEFNDRNELYNARFNAPYFSEGGEQTMVFYEFLVNQGGQVLNLTYRHPGQAGMIIVNCLGTDPHRKLNVNHLPFLLEISRIAVGLVDNVPELEKSEEQNRLVQTKAAIHLGMKWLESRQATKPIGFSYLRR